MEKLLSPRLKNEYVTEQKANDLFRENLIRFIKTYDNSYVFTDFSNYSITQLVLLKVNIEIIKKN